MTLKEQLAHLAQHLREAGPGETCSYVAWALHAYALLHRELLEDALPTVARDNHLHDTEESMRLLLDGTQVRIRFTGVILDLPDGTSVVVPGG